MKISWKEGEVILETSEAITAPEYDDHEGMRQVPILSPGIYIFHKAEGNRSPVLDGHTVEMGVLGTVKIDGHKMPNITFLFSALHKYIEGYRPSRNFQDYSVKKNFIEFIER